MIWGYTEGYRPQICVKFPPWGRVSAPTGVAPEALEEYLYSSKGYKRRPAGLLHWGGRPASFLAGIGTLSATLGISVLVQRPSVQLNHQVGAR